MGRSGESVCEAKLYMYIGEGMRFQNVAGATFLDTYCICVLAGGVVCVLATHRATTKKNTGEISFW